MTETLTQTITLINDRFLGYILMAALMIAGLYFTFASRFVQFVRPKEMFRLMTSGNKKKGHISSFQAFSISTASRVGTEHRGRGHRHYHGRAGRGVLDVADCGHRRGVGICRKHIGTGI